MAEAQVGACKGRHFTSEATLSALRWNLAVPVSCRGLVSMLLDRGAAVDHTTLSRWAQAYAVKLEQRVRRPLRPCTGSWRVDKTYIEVKGVCTYRYHAVDSLGQTIDFLLSARRTLAGYEAVAMIRKRQVTKVGVTACGRKLPSSPGSLKLPPERATLQRLPRPDPTFATEPSIELM